MIILTIFLIYLTTIDKKIYYVSLNDYTLKENSKDISLYFKKNNLLNKYISYTNDTARVTDLINDIKSNIKIKKKNIKNVLIKADLITLSIGNNDVLSILNNYHFDDYYKYLDDITNDIEELFILLKEYSKEDIFFLNLINTNEDAKFINAYDYLNKRIEILCQNYDITFIKTTDNITTAIINKINKQILNKI
jgi:hypothetical protein